MPDAAPRSISVFLVLIPFAVAALMVAGWPLASDGDLYFHLTLGQLIAQSHHWITEDLFSYSQGRLPEETHCWLAQWLFWDLFRLGGEVALRLFNFSVVAGILALAARYGWRVSRNAGGALLAASLALVIHHEVQTLRPLLFGELFFALLFFELLGERKPMTARQSLAAISLVAVWTNLHASVLGVIPFFFLHALAVPREFRGRQLAIALAAAAATLLNPQGWGLWRYAWETARVGREIGIAEWRTLLCFPVPPAFFGRVTLLCLGLVLLFALGQRKEERYLSLLLGIFLLLACFSVRHVVYLLFPLVAAISHVYGRRRLGFLVACSIALLGAFRVWESPLATPPITRATSFLTEAGVTGNAFNFPAWGSYLIFARFPELRVAHTLRLYTHHELLELEDRQDRLYGGLVFPEMLKVLPETDLVIVPSHYPVRHFLSAREWTILFENNTATIALRRTPRNSRNLTRVERYYYDHEVPFDPTIGFDPQTAARVNPAWWEGAQEPPAFGWWPRAEVVRRWQESNLRYAVLRHFAPGESPPESPLFYWRD